MHLQRLFFLLLFVFFIFFPQQSFAQAEDCQIRHIGKQSETDTRHEFPLQVLSLLLEVTEESYGKCKLTPVEPAAQKRLQTWLSEGNNVDVAWLPVTKELNERLLPVPFPIRKGFLGWRVLLAKPELAEEMQHITDLQGLKKYRAGFGVSWGDLPVMQHHFNKVVTAVSYDAIFEMLIRGRFDFLSRAVYEAYDELSFRNAEKEELVIVPKIALHYKEADFFYVNKDNAYLHDRLSEGFRRIIQDGSFNLLFYSYYADYIEQINMHERIVIDLDNPFLPTNVPIEDPELWFQLNIYNRLKTTLKEKKN